MRHYIIPARVAIIKKNKMAIVDVDMEKDKLFHITGGNVN